MLHPLRKGEDGVSNRVFLPLPPRDRVAKGRGEGKAFQAAEIRSNLPTLVFVDPGLAHTQFPAESRPVRGTHVDTFRSASDLILLFEPLIDFSRPSRWRHEHFTPRTVGAGQDVMSCASGPSRTKSYRVARCWQLYIPEAGGSRIGYTRARL
jgi:hypothetical protein